MTTEFFASETPVVLVGEDGAVLLGEDGDVLVAMPPQSNWRRSPLFVGADRVLAGLGLVRDIEGR